MIDDWPAASTYFWCSFDGSYPNALSADRILTHYQLGSGTTPWVWSNQSRAQLFTANARGQQTIATDPEGNLTVYVRYPENDPDGQSSYVTPGLSTQQYGFVKEVHVDADPNMVMTLVGSEGDMTTFIGNKIPRLNTPGVYQDLITRYTPSSTSAGCTSCAYDPLGNPLSSTDPRGFTTTFERNELGEVYRTTTDAPYSQRVETYYDANRNVTQVDTEDRQVQYESDDITDPAFAKFIPTGSGSVANLRTKAGLGGSVRPGWFTNLFIYDLLDNRTQDDIDATGSTPASLVTAYQYDFNQNLTKITKPQGNLVEYDYDERDLRIATRVGYDPANSNPGAVTITAYDGNENVIDVVGPAQRGTTSQSLSVVIDDAFRSGSALTHVGDWVAANTYDGFDRMIQSTDTAGGIRASTFDPGGRVIASQANGTAGGATPADRTGSLNVQLSSGATNFDEAGRAYEQLQKVFLNTGISGGSPTHAPPSGRSVTHTGGGLATNSTANSSNTTVTLTTGGTSSVLSRTVFDRASRTSTAAADNTSLTSYAYDGANRQVTMTDALGNQVQNTFDGNGNVVTSTRLEKCTIPGVDTVESFAGQMRYDLLNRLVVLAQQGPDGNLDPTLNTCCVPPATPNLTIFTLYGYDSRGNRTNLIDPKQNTTVWTYDGVSRQLENLRQLRTNGDGTQATFDTVTSTSAYDANGRLLKLIDDNGGTTTWSYDTLDRQTVMTFHDGSTRTSTYDLANDPTGYVDENGSIFANTFDVLGRKTAVSITLATNVVGTTDQSFQFDGLSRVTFSRDTVSSANADAAFAFDSIGRAVEEGQTYNSDTRYITHDAFTGLTGMDLTYPSGRKITNAYDTLYRRNAINETSGGASIAAWEFFGSRMATVSLGNGITCSMMNDAQTASATQAGGTYPPTWGDATTDRLGYDGSGRMIAKRFLPSGSTASLVGFTTQYDPSSNKLYERALQAESRSALYPSYDSMDRLLEYQRGALASGGGSVSSPITLSGTDSQRDYNLDGLGNWHSTVYTPEGTTTPTTEIRQHNKLNEVTQVAGTPIRYDHGNNAGSSYPLIAQRGNGNITDDGTRVYAYDALNRLTNVTRKSDSTQVAAYAYDALGRRVQKIVTNGGIAIGIANLTYRYLYDNQQIIEESLFSNSGYALLRQFVWGQYVDELIQFHVSTSSLPFTAGTYYPLQDLNYRAITTTDSSGNIVEAYDYDAYGNTLMFSAAGTGGNWWADDATKTLQPMCECLFTGRQVDPETENYWYRARYYLPVLGRFGGRDAIGIVLIHNLYLYVLDNPATFVDPFGLEETTTTFTATPAALDEKISNAVNKLSGGFSEEFNAWANKHGAKQNADGTVKITYSCTPTPTINDLTDEDVTMPEPQPLRKGFSWKIATLSMGPWISDTKTSETPTSDPCCNELTKSGTVNWGVKAGLDLSIKGKHEIDLKVAEKKVTHQRCAMIRRWFFR